MRDPKIRFYDSNHLDEAVIIAPDGGSFPLSNCLDVASRATFYRPGTNTFTIEIDMLSNVNCSLMALMGRANTPIVWSESAEITVKGNNLNQFTGNEPFSRLATVTDTGVFAYLDTDDSPEGQQFRYWRIEINDEYNPEVIDINYLFLGEAFTFNHNINKGFSINVDDQTLKNRADSGRIFTRQRPQLRRLDSLGVSFLDYDTSKDLLDFVTRQGAFRPFLVSIDPTEKCFDYEFSHYICFFERLPVATHIKTNVFSVNFSLVESV